jgi:OOP family OmpA-OmpF porin
MKFGPVLGTVCVALTLAMPAAAQDSSNLSAEELRELFQKQKTRGLIITPGTEATAPEGTAGETTDVAAANPDLVSLPVEEQVNIQIRFDFDSAALKDEEKPKLVALCEAMKSVDVQLFRIVGHTDSSGTDQYNQALSLLRAEEVKRHLVSECGIDGARLEAVGAGEAQPFDANDPRADANRRVEFQALS